MSQLTALGTTAATAGTAHAAVAHGGTVKPSLNFGSIRVGTKLTEYIEVTNSGNTQGTVTGVGKLNAPFGAALKPPTRMSFNPGDDMILPVTFAPTKKGTFSTQCKITWRDVNGEHSLTVTISGTAV